jgi:hypothetical protein
MSEAELPYAVLAILARLVKSFTVGPSYSDVAAGGVTALS